MQTLNTTFVNPGRGLLQRQMDKNDLFHEGGGGGGGSNPRNSPPKSANV